jgi:putative component of membrane protein insertase Oxa1/YidC/SpoIIIJ protein YidD
MKYFIILAIKLYWRLIPASKRNKCLFSESCSKYVYKQTMERGFWTGIQSFKLRYRQCRPGYRLSHVQHIGPVMHLADGSIVRENEFSSFILQSPEYEKIKLAYSEVNDINS